MEGNQIYRDGLGRVMPTVFVAGPAKSGSTFLWDCIHQTFHPQRVCGAVEGPGRRRSYKDLTRGRGLYWYKCKY